MNAAAALRAAVRVALNIVVRFSVPVFWDARGPAGPRAGVSVHR